MRATIEHFYRTNKGNKIINDELPAIRAQLVLGPENLSIKVFVKNLPLYTSNIFIR